MTVDIGNTTMCTSPFIPNSTLLFGLYYIKSTRAIGIYNSADLARLVYPRVDVLIYAFARIHCALRRHHLFSIPIAILGILLLKS